MLPRGPGFHDNFVVARQLFLDHWMLCVKCREEQHLKDRTTNYITDITVMAYNSEFILIHCNTNMEKIPKHAEWHLYRKWLWNSQEGLHWPPHANSRSHIDYRHIWAHCVRIAAGCSRTRWNCLIWSFPKLPQALTICLPQPGSCTLRLENASVCHDLYLTFDHDPPCLHTLTESTYLFGKICNHSSTP